MIGARPDLPPFPNGWFAFGFSDELRPGKLLARAFMGQEVTVFRTQSGQAYAVDSYCPHFGAHFGYGGEVRGETLECGSHGFRFNGQGTCVRTGYDVPIPPRAKLGTWPLREIDGLLLVYYHVDNQPPTWEVPLAGTHGWAGPIYKSFLLDAHPQEASEFGAGLPWRAHISTRTFAEFEARGPYLNTVYTVKHALRIFGFELTDYDFEFETQIYGLGYALVDLRVPLFRMTARLWVLPTSMDAEHLTLRLALRMKKRGSALGVLASPLVAHTILNGFIHDAGLVFPIWGRKRPVLNGIPSLALQAGLPVGSGPLEKYRQWSRQFYR